MFLLKTFNIEEIQNGGKGGQQVTGCLEPKGFVMIVGKGKFFRVTKKKW